MLTASVGSNPTISTNTNSVSRACPFRHRDFELRCHHAQVAKLAHADALGASAARLAGSNPVLSTIGDRSPPSYVISPSASGEVKAPQVGGNADQLAPVAQW